MNLLSFSDRLQAAMDAEGLRQTDLANKVGLSRAAINQLITGSSKGMKPDNLVAVARALRVRIEWLATGEEPMRDPITPEDRATISELHQLDPEKRVLILANIRAMLPPPTLPLHLKAEGTVSAHRAYQGQERRAHS